MNSGKWLFDQGPRIVAITSIHVTENGSDIVLVIHYKDDRSWSFQSGAPFSQGDVRLVLMKRIVEIDPTVAEVADLPIGWAAKREKIGAQWRRYKNE